MKALTALFATTILLAACSSSQVTIGPASPDGAEVAAVTQSAAGPTTPSHGEADASSQPAVTRAQPAPAPVIGSNPPCLPTRELPRGPLGCTQPQRPPLPPVQGARIAWCGPFPMIKSPAPISVLAHITVCGSGFASAEVVTLTLSGRYGTTSWTVTAGLGGTFQSGLLPATCRNFPGTIQAHGSRGHQSNVLPLAALPCRPGL